MRDPEEKPLARVESSGWAKVEGQECGIGPERGHGQPFVGPVGFVTGGGGRQGTWGCGLQDVFLAGDRNL